MATKKRRGRPRKYLLAPRINASAETVAETVLRAGRPKRQVRLSPNLVYRCKGCEAVVTFPDVLYDDARCKDCTTEK